MKKAVKFLAAVVLTLSVSSTFVSCVEEEPEFDLQAAYEASLPNLKESEEKQVFRISMCTNYRIMSIKNSNGLELVGTPSVANQLSNLYDFNKNVITITNGGNVVSKTDYVLKINASEPIKFRDLNFPFELLTKNETYKNFTYVPLTESEKDTRAELGAYDLFVRKITFTVSVNNEDLTYILISNELRK